MRKIAKTISEWTGQAIQDKRIPAETNLSHLNTILVATTLGYRLPLPSGPVTRAKEWYLMHCFAGIEELVGQLNEYLILDFDKAMELTRTVWLQRYRMVHQPMSDEAMHVMLHGVLEAEADIAPVYRECLCALEKGPVQQIISWVSLAMDEHKVLPVGAADEEVEHA